MICLVDPLGCFTDGLVSLADSILSLFPFGLYGIVFLGGMIVGERIGLWGILIAIIGWIAIRFGSRGKDDFVGDVTGHDAAPSPPLPRRRQSVPKRKTIVDVLKRLRK